MVLVVVVAGEEVEVVVGDVTMLRVPSCLFTMSARIPLKTISEEPSRVTEL